mgnify:CR=1 FL=1
MSRQDFFKILDKCCNGTVMSFEGWDYMKVTETVIECLNHNIKYFKGLDW